MGTEQGQIKEVFRRLNLEIYLTVLGREPGMGWES